MLDFKNKSLKFKLLFLVIAPIVVISITGILVTSIMISKNGKQGLIDKSTAILSRMEAVRSFVAEQGMLEKEIENFTSDSLFTELKAKDKELILNLVPIIASWKVGEKNASIENYEFRICSEKPRNPKNKATEQEAEFLQQIKNENLTTLTHIDRKTNSIWVMRPVYLVENEGCLKCHGDESLSPFGNGKDIVGYKMEGWTDGEMRGLFIIKSDLKPVQSEILKAIITITLITIIIGIIAILFGSFIVKKITTTFEQLKNITRKISEGDLREKAIIESDDDLGEISKFTNSMVISLNTILKNVSTSVENLETSSNEISQSSDTISQGAQEQAAHFEQLASSVQNTADSSVNASYITVSTVKNVNLAGESMNKVLDSILNIEKSSKKITDAIGLISEISFKTNLLSINAGIEAARAGEYGAGFTVVANEIRQLAFKSSEAAKQIANVIKTSIREVEEGVKITKKANSQITEIVKDINRISLELELISASAKEQSNSMEQTTNVISSNASSAEQLAAAAQSLAIEAKELFDLVKNFKLAEG